MSRETDIELLNKSDRWVICLLSVNQVQGDKHNVRLTLPKDVILIKPNSQQIAKVKIYYKYYRNVKASPYLCILDCSDNSKNE